MDVFQNGKMKDNVLNAMIAAKKFKSVAREGRRGDGDGEDEDEVEVVEEEGEELGGDSTDGEKS